MPLPKGVSGGVPKASGGRPRGMRRPRARTKRFPLLCAIYFFLSIFSFLILSFWTLQRDTRRETERDGTERIQHVDTVELPGWKKGTKLEAGGEIEASTDPNETRSLYGQDQEGAHPKTDAGRQTDGDKTKLGGDGGDEKGTAQTIAASVDGNQGSVERTKHGSLSDVQDKSQQYQLLRESMTQIMKQRQERYINNNESTSHSIRQEDADRAIKEDGSSHARRNFSTLDTGNQGSTLNTTGWITASNTSLPRFKEQAFGDNNSTNVATQVEPKKSAALGSNSELKVRYSAFLTEDEWYNSIEEAHDAGRLEQVPPFFHSLTDRMDELGSLPVRASFINTLKRTANPTPETRVCFVAVTAANLEGIRRELFPWLQYHIEMGVERFYIFYDGTDITALQMLEQIDVVQVIPLRLPLADEYVVEKLKSWADGHRQWGHRPGNYELMVKQTFSITLAIQLAKEEGMDWIMHIDPDELLIAESEASYSIMNVLGNQPPYISSVRFMNNEAVPEYEGVLNRFDEVSLFRVHKHFLTPDADSQRAKARLGDNRAYMNLYVNGKSAARVDAPGLRQIGPHMFKGDSSERWMTPDNPDGNWRDIISNTTAILHYAYCQESDIVSKANRSCPPEYREAAISGDRKKTKECFVLDFDQDVYHVAATGDRTAIRKFFLSRLVLEQGAAIKCTMGNAKGYCLMEDIEEYKATMMKHGILKRYHFPHVVLRFHERTIKTMISPVE